MLATVEELNAHQPNGYPPHVLRIKLGVPVVVIRNMCVEHNVLNGTRGTVVKIHQHYIDLKLTSGANIGAVVSIPRITFMPDSVLEHNRFRVPTLK